MLIRLLKSLLNIKFFNKMFLVNTCIVIVALFALAQIISGNITSSSIERDNRYDKLVLYNISSLFDQKRNVVLQLAKQAYSKASPDRRVFEFLEFDLDTSSLEYFEMRERFIDYLNSTFSIDTDMTGVTLYKKLDETCYLVSKNSKDSYPASSFKNPKILEQFRDFSPNVRLYPSSTSVYLPKKNIYTMAMNIKLLSNYNNVGTLVVDFDVDEIAKTIHRYYEEVTSDILVLLDDGSVIYDSSNGYYDSKIPYSNLLKENKPRLVLEGQECIINKFQNSDLGITVIGIMPVGKSLEKISNARRTVFLVSFFCILAVLILSYITTRVFSRRISTIMHAIKKIRQGDLKTRIRLSLSKDEFYEISEGMNKMCSDLERYINRVYISELKQKSAQLMALQAQINPHFLYNTLEAIRMKANTSGATEAGDMILILSKLFRNTIKEATIIDINEEVESSMLYLKLFEIRYGNRLSVTFDIDNSILEYGIIRHVIQPIIENYIFHGFDSSSSNNTICIKACKEDEYIYISIIDNGTGIKENDLAVIKNMLKSDCPTNTGSIGLTNVNERIKIIFGQECGIEILSNQDKGTTVKIKILAKTVEELKMHV
ncbi:MAG TPA: sensor histidine kinase [Ruminiclostridium sp.]